MVQTEAVVSVTDPSGDIEIEVCREDFENIELATPAIERFMDRDKGYLHTILITRRGNRIVFKPRPF